MVIFTESIETQTPLPVSAFFVTSWVFTGAEEVRSTLKATAAFELDEDLEISQ